MYIHQLESIIIFVIMACLVHIEVLSFMWMLRCYIDRIGTFSLQCPHFGDLSLSVIVYAGILLARFSKLGR